MSCDASGKYFFIFVLFLILFPTISHSFWDFPGGPVDNAPPSNTGNTIPGWGAKIPLVSGPKNQSVIPKQYCNKFKKDFKKNGPHQKILRKKKTHNTIHSHFWRAGNLPRVHLLHNCSHYCLVLSLSHVQLFVTPWTVARSQPPGSSVHEISRQCWGGLPFPSPGDLPNPGITPVPPALAGGLFTTEPLGKHRTTGERTFP